MLHSSGAGRHNKGLAEGVDVPVGPGPRLEGGGSAVDAGRGLRLEPVAHPDGAGEVLSRRQIGGRRPPDDGQAVLGAGNRRGCKGEYQGCRDDSCHGTSEVGINSTLSPLEIQIEDLRFGDCSGLKMESEYYLEFRFLANAQVLPLLHVDSPHLSTV